MPPSSMRTAFSLLILDEPASRLAPCGRTGLQSRIRQGSGELNMGEYLVTEPSLAAVVIPVQRLVQPIPGIFETFGHVAETLALGFEQGPGAVAVIVTRIAMVLAVPTGHFLGQVGGCPLLWRCRHLFATQFAMKA